MRLPGQRQEMMCEASKHPPHLGFNMSRNKKEYQVSGIGHVQHSRLVLRHAIQMILYGRIIDYY